MKSFNFINQKIRCVSGVNLNLLRYATMLLCVLVLGIGNAWGGNSNYYTKVTLSKTGTGSGKVYAQKGATTGTWTENGTTSPADNQSSAPTHTWYLKATPNDGSAFTGWGSFNGWQSNPSADGEYYKGTIVGNTNANSANGTATATFVPVEVNEISATSHTFSPLVNARTDCNNYKQTITFTTKYADAMADFVGDNAVLAKTAGDGVFALDGAPSLASNTVSATVKFTGNNRYAATPGGSRTSTATLTLTSKGSSSQTKTCTFTATFPSASVTSGKLTVSGAESDLYTTNTNPVNGNVEFAVMYADALGDFTLPAAVTEKSHSGDTWSIGTITGPNTNYETGAGKIVIPITFTSEEGKYGDHTAKITLGGVTVTMTAHVEELADYDVKVVDADGTTVLHKGAWGDDAFSALNGHAGSTLIVGRDFNIGSVSSVRAISQNVTLDLNGKAVTATLTAAGSLLSVTSGKTLTIGGVKGGSLSVTGNVAGRIAIVEVQNGSLNLQRGDLEITNSNSGSGTESNPYAAGVYLASRAWSGGKPTVTMAMSGGSITAKRTAGGHGYGICCAGSGNSASSIDLTGGTITAEVPNGTYALGVYVSGHSNISNMTINASSSTNPYAIFTGASDAKVVISSGTYSSVSTGANPRALLTRGNVSVMGGTFTTSGTTGAYGLYVSNGTAVINAGSFSATATAGVAYGLGLPNGGAHTAKVNGGSFSATGTTAAYAANTTANTTLITTAGTFTATASGENTDVKAYGLNLVANATANVAGATFRGITSGNAAVAGTNGNSQPKGAYGIFNLGNLTVTDCTLEGQSARTYAYGLYTTQSVTMTGTSLSAETSGANGADHATALYINGSGKTVTANDCSFSAVANTTYAYGVYAYAGIMESNNSNYFAETKQTGASSAAGCLSRGIYNNSGTTVTLNGGEISCIGNTSYSQNAYGIYTAGTATITDATISCTGVNTGYALYVEGANATMTVNSGKFKGTSSALKISSPKKIELYGGFYSHDTNLKTYKAMGCEVYDTSDGSVEKEQGYNFKVADGSNPGVVVAKVYNSSSTLLQSYNTLVEALQFVNANSGTQYTIVMVGDYVLPAGDYTVPPQTALVIPDANTRTKPQGTKPNRVSVTTPAPTPFRKLTLVDGTHITVYGTIETTANQNTSAGGSALSGAPTGPYGYIQMNAGSTISMESGSNLNSWGYIIGKGEITAQKGSTIREQFQMGYWRGGTATSHMVSNRNSWHAFPVMDYFYQNIEAPITYRPGATAYGYSKVHQSYDWVANDIKLLGTSEAMFLMDNDASEDNTWVRKEYNPATDRVEWTMNSGAKLGNFRFTMANQNINSADYYLPITNNMTITIKDGDCTITQDVILVPGAQLNINKTAKLKVSSGKKLFVVDTEDWKKCGSSYYYKANYSPSWTNPNSNPRTATQMPDAEIFVHGETEGSYYTSTHGANIHSTNEDAGKVKFIAAAGAATSIQQITSTNCDRSQVDFTTAKLKNEKEVNGSYYTPTEETQAGYAYIYEDQQWVNVLDGCLTTRTDGSGTHYYARPGDNVAVLENDGDAAYHGELAKDADRNFIFTEKSMTATDAANCVWWEAEKIGDIDGDGKIYYMANKEKYENYGAYYYYKSDVGYWVPRYVSITWSYQVDGSAKSVTYNSVYYHTSPVFAEFTNPHKKDDATYSYAWTGWTDEDGLFYAKDGVLPLATKNTTYTAVFEATRLQGSVSFKNYNGGALESRLFDSETIPTCSLTPTRSADVESVYTFDGWSTSAGGNKAYEINGLPAVVKNTSVTYYAHFSASPRPYVITFANYNGDAIQNTEFGYNSHPTYNGADPTRANSGFWSYNFIGWVDKDETFYAKGDELPIVSGVTTYTAKYEAVDWTPEYTITFKDGDNKVLTTQTARLNAVPEYAGVTPTKTATAQYTYTFNNTWSPAIVAATKNETYTAQFDSELRSYTITFCNETGRELSSATFDYGATPVYGGETPKKARVGSTIYTFDGWSSTMGGAKLDELPSVSKAATYYAHFSNEPVYVVRFNAQGHGTAPANQEVIRGNKVVEPDALSEIGYDFGGWYKDDACMQVWNFGSDVVTASTTLFAKWTPISYTITFNSDGGTLVNSITQGYETSVTAPADPTREGYTFDGWDPAVPSTMPLNGKTCVAQWTPNTNTPYVVKHFKQALDGGYDLEHPDDIDNLTGTTAMNVTPDRKSYEGFTAPAGQEVSILADGSRVVEYKYTRNSYNLSWSANGGNALTGSYTTGSVKYGASITAPNTPTKTGYDFAGWDNGTEVVTPASQMPALDLTYTATWTAKSYLVTLHTDEGTINSGNVESYTYGEGATLPMDVSRLGFDFVGWYDNSELTGDAVTAIPADAIGDKEYWAKWTVTKCTITWVNYDGTPLSEEPTSIEWDGTPGYPNLDNPEREGDANRTYTFIGWYPEIHAANGNETYTAQYSMSITTGEPGTYTVSGTEDAVATTVQVSGALHIPEGNSLTTGDLIVEAYSNGSGTIDGIERVTVTGDAYFDYEFNVDPWHWSAFGVPFEIDLDAAAPLKEKTEALGILSPDDYDIVYYDTEERANNGASKNCWKYVDNETTHRLIPGRLYMIAFDKHVGHVGTVRFKKAALAPVNSTTPVDLITTGPAGGNNNWNGIANPMMYHALLGAGVTECQVHDGGEIGKDGYYTYDMNNKKFYVGKAAFVQVPNNQSPVVVTPATDQSPIVQHAPRRAQTTQTTESRYDIQIAPAEGAAADRLLILAEEDKADEYVIVSDLAKAGVSPVRAQMWVDRYGEKLCKNTTAYVNNKADYPLVISAPAAGEYEIFINEMPDDETMLYLTYNGKAIWNLSYSAYVADMENGTTNNYGLRIVRTRKAGTDIEETTIQNGDAVRKVIVDDKVYIIRNGEIYSITGQKAK